MEYKVINNNETGSLVRGKINQAFQQLITGREGINEVWKTLTTLSTTLSEAKEDISDTDTRVTDISDQLQDYTDREIAGLVNYVNAMNGGVSGFAKDTSYNPNFPVDRAATVITTGAGTFTNIRDINSNPITIANANSFTIFFKPAGVSYWEYKTLDISIDLLQTTGTSTTATMSQNAVSSELTRIEDSLSATISERTSGVVVCKGVLNYNQTPEYDGVYLQKDSEGKLKSIKRYTGGVGVSLTPFVGRHYVTPTLVYLYNGKEFILSGEGTGGTGSGFLNVTKEVPLSSGYYNINSAVAALRNVDIDEEDKLGKIITFEASEGNWVDYRFLGWSTILFYEEALWKPYGGKGSVKVITVVEGSQVTDKYPDEEGRLNLYLPVIEVDQEVNETSTNPVSGKAVSAEVSSLLGKFGASLRLNTIEEGDEKAYSLSLLTEGGTELSTTEVFTGGGGGGGSILPTKIVLTKTTPNVTTKVGDTVSIGYSYDHIDTTTGSSTGNPGKAITTITKGTTVYSYEEVVSPGATNLRNISGYLSLGTNTVKVRVEVGEGVEKQVSTITWVINVVQLVLTSTFNIASVINRGDVVSVPYSLTGSGNKTIRCYVDGVDTEDRAVSATSSNGVFSIPTSGMTHGAHSIQLVAELELPDGIIKSNSIYFEVAVRVAGDSTPIITTRFDYQDGAIITSERPYINTKQYDTYKLVYAAYNPAQTPSKVDVYATGVLVSSANVTFTTNTLSLRSLKYGVEDCLIKCGSTEYAYKLKVTKNEIDLQEPIDLMKLKLTAEGRSNNDTNKTSWTYGNIQTDFSNFNWGGDGWINNSLRHIGEARSVVRYKPLLQPSSNASNAFTFMVKYKVSDVTNETAPVISCVDENGTGFVITPTEARLTTKGNTQLSMKMASGNEYEVAFVSFPASTTESSEYEKSNTEMVYLYIDGVMVGGAQRGSSDSVYQASAKDITMGSSGATLDVYLMRAYSTFLSDSQVLACYMIDQSTADALISKYNFNDILDDNGYVDIDKVPSGMRITVVTGQQENGVPTLLQAAVDNNKKAKYNVPEIISFVKNGTPQQNFKLLGGSLSLQGTSSLAYPIKNYKFYFYNTNKVPGTLYLGCDEQGLGGTAQENPVFSFRLSSTGTYAAAPVNCFCAKADFAESSSSHNTGMARLVQDTLAQVGDLVPPQKFVDRTKYQYDVRTTIDGEPCLLFYRNTVNDTPVFLGKYNWNNDKSTEAVFGFLDIPGYHDQSWVTQKFGGKNPTQCWEFLNNDYPMGMFLDDDFVTKGADGVPNWMKVFEARYPDDDNINDQYEAGTLRPVYLEALVKWVKSTDTTAAGLSESQKEARRLKFKTELSNYFDVPFLCDYYEFTEIFACVDQRVKNMMMAFWYSPSKDRMLAYMIFYDNDTILGVRNDGRLKYNWDVNEDTTDPELSTPQKTVYAFAGRDSVLWKNLRDVFPAELKESYKRIRAKLTNDFIFKYFDKEQTEKFCERIYNLDAINKYVIPKTIGISITQNGATSVQKYSYLESMQGSRKSHRRWFVTNRLNLFDAWASTGQYTSVDISFKGNSPIGATVRAVSARQFYFEFRREGETMVSERVERDQEWSYTYPQVANIGTIFHLYGGSWMKKLDLSDWGGFTDLNIPTLPVLEELILGKDGETYTITGFPLGSNVPLVKRIDIRNYINITTLDLRACSHLEELNASGCTKLANVLFGESCPLETFYVPENYQTLTLRSLPKLSRSRLVLGNITNITGLWVENCAQLDSRTLFEEIYNTPGNSLKYVRISGINIEGDGSELAQWYASGLGGITENGVLVDNVCKIRGTYQLNSYMDDELIETYRARFDELVIRQPNYTMLVMSDGVADPANYTNLDNKTGYLYGNAYQPSGHINTILKKRNAYLGKQATEGTMTICKLSDSDLRLFSDGTTNADLSGTQGDVFMYEPAYWYKGVNDVLNSKKYICYNSEVSEPVKPDVTVVTIEKIRTEGRFLEQTVVDISKPNVTAALLSGSSFDFYGVASVSVEGYKKVRFQGVLSDVYGFMFSDASGNSVSTGFVGQGLGYVNGMYLIKDVPQNATQLHFTVAVGTNPVNPHAVLDKVVLSRSTRVEDLEPDWVRTEEYLAGVFESTLKDGKLMSVVPSTNSLAYYTSAQGFYNHAEVRKLQLRDWSMFSNTSNLFFAKYGTRDGQYTCGPGSSSRTTRYVGNTAFLGNQDTLFPEGSAWSNSYYYASGSLRTINNSKAMGYENLWGNLMEVLQGVRKNSNSLKITLDDGTQRNIPMAQSGYVKYVLHEKYADVASCTFETGGFTTTFYCDTTASNYYENSVLAVGGTYDEYAGGLTCVNTSLRDTDVASSLCCRLAFKGNIIKENNINVFKQIIDFL